MHPSRFCDIKLYFSVIITVFEAPSQLTLQPIPSATARAGTRVLSESTIGGVSSVISVPPTFIVLLPTVRLTVFPFFVPLAVWVFSSQLTVAPSFSKILRMGTRVLSLYITGFWSNVTLLPETVTVIFSSEPFI